jgi:hypothetical protein
VHATRRRLGVTRCRPKLKAWKMLTCPPSMHFFSSRPAADHDTSCRRLQRLQLFFPTFFSLSSPEVLWKIEVVFVASD